MYRRARGPLKTRAKFGEKKNPNKQEKHFVDERENEVVEFIRSIRENDINCKISVIRELLNENYPATQYRNKTKWDTTTLERLIAYHNIPGAKPNYINRKKKTDLEIDSNQAVYISRYI